MQRCRLRFFETPWCILPRSHHICSETADPVRRNPYDGRPGDTARSAGRVGRRAPAGAARRHPPGARAASRCRSSAATTRRCSRSLKAAVDRGVAVEVLVTSRAKGGKKKMAKLWRALEQTGATLHSYTDPVVKYHAKYLVADDGPAIVASLNFTRKCFEKTCDALVVTHDPGGGRRICAGCGPPTAAACRCRADLAERLIVGPERARRQFTALIEGARPSIRLIDAKLSDPDLVSLLNAKRAAGMTVERFRAKQLGELKSHGKIMLHRRPDRRRRQPGAGGAEPRLPPRGGDRRHRADGGRRARSSCSRRCATRRPAGRPPRQRPGEVAVLIAVVSARRWSAPPMPLRRPRRATPLRAGAGHARSREEGQERQEAERSQAEEAEEEEGRRRTTSRRPTSRSIRDADRAGRRGCELLVEAASVDALRRRLPPRRRRQDAGGRPLGLRAGARARSPGSSIATASASRATSPSRSSTKSSTSSPSTS